MTIFQSLPPSVLQAGAIFLSIMIEALPFVLIGSLISGLIEVYITPDKVYEFLPRNRWGRIFFGTFIGFLFPSCECGIVPIINRFLEKKVPSYTAVPFLVTAPIINPIVLFATYSAFGNSLKFAFLRALGAIVIALVLGIFLGFSGRNPFKKRILSLAMNMTFHTWVPLEKSFRYLYKLLMSFSIWGVTWSLAVSLRLSCRSMSRLGS